MASLYELKNKKTQYTNLKYSLQVISDGLSKSIEHLEAPSSKVDTYYLKNDEGKGSKLLSYRNTLIEKRSEINNQIIPQIDNEIYYLKKKITDEELKQQMS